jgi:hypothetical protein
VETGFRVVSKSSKRKRKACTSGDGEVIRGILCLQRQYEEQTDQLPVRKFVACSALQRLLSMKCATGDSIQ